MERAKPFSKNILFEEKKQRSYTGESLTQIAMPIGGIGAGSICLSGIGSLIDYSIMHQPATTAMPDGHVFTPAAFAIIHFPQTKITRLVEGPMPKAWIYNQGLKGQGYRGGGHEGLPRFRNVRFQGEYPFGIVEIWDENIPLKINLTAFNPFIPLDDINSGIPCAILEYTLENPTSANVDYEFSFHISHFAPGRNYFSDSCTRNEVIPKKGVYLYNVEPSSHPVYGNCSLSVIGYTPLIKAMWFRGGWFDSISALWREVSTGSFLPNDGKDADQLTGRNGGSILLKGSLEPGDKITYPIVITWYFPNVNYSVGRAKGSECCSTDHNCMNKEDKPACWKPFYVTQWKNARDVSEYVHQNYPFLRQKTQAFHDALFRTTAPSYVLDAISANLAIIKSPTVLRLENGHMWGWEGCFCNQGCCHGSCTHVWNYAQSIAHLFPQLERTLREQEYLFSMDDRGHINFRSALPEGPAEHNFHAASDGQLGGIMKLYREWRICGDKNWLEKLYPFAKRSLDYCIQTWDPHHKGVLEEPHHNTYDIEFWGPDGMCSSFYIGALAAFALIARESGHEEDAGFYENLTQKGAQYLDQYLFNGEYYQQKVEYDALHDTSFSQFIANITEESPQEYQLLKTEGPKYQYGSGCISDGVLGAWLAKNCFIQTPQNQENIRKNLESIFAYNFKSSLWDHANPQRPGYALGDEPGLLLCTWPRGGKPTLPFVYSDEVWTGIEYQVASHLISEGFVDEGLTIVYATRSRYDGKVRNPWNEYECGNYYARAMSSYALLAAISGFQYSPVDQKLVLSPKFDHQPFCTFFSTASGWGTITINQDQVEINLEAGSLSLHEFVLTWKNKTIIITTKSTILPNKPLIIPINGIKGE